MGVLLNRSTLIRLGVGLAVVGSLATAVIASANPRDRREAAPPDAPPAGPSTTATAEQPATTDTTFITATSAPTTTARPSTTRARVASTTTAKPQAKPASGQQAVTAFTAAVDRGDAAAAWRLLAPRSQAFWRSQARFAASFDKLSEGGFGGWTATADRSARSVVVESSGDGEILIVTLRGSTIFDGQPAVRANAFPVRHVKGTFLLELFDFGGGDTVPEVTAPGPVFNATIRTSDRRPTFQARAESEEVAWALDDRDATLTNRSGGVAGYQPEQPLAPGTHVLTVASVGRSWLTATAVVVHIS